VNFRRAATLSRIDGRRELWVEGGWWRALMGSSALWATPCDFADRQDHALTGLNEGSQPEGGGACCLGFQASPLARALEAQAFEQSSKTKFWSRLSINSPIPLSTPFHSPLYFTLYYLPYPILLPNLEDSVPSTVRGFSRLLCLSHLPVFLSKLELHLGSSICRWSLP
jgi:hypothetical protein